MSLTTESSFVSLAALAGSFAAPFPLEIVEVRVAGATGGTSTVVAKNGSTVATITLDGSKNGFVGSTAGVAKNTAPGTNQPNDTGVGYVNNIFPAVPNTVPVTSLAAGDVLSVATASASAGTVTVVYLKK